MAVLALGLSSCRTGLPEVGLYVIDPGHFHAALVQKNDLEGVSDTVHVYAPEGKELDSYLATMNSFSGRDENPVSWIQKVHAGEDYLAALPQDDGCNAVVLSGNNRMKSLYISSAVGKGYNVLSDKPMAIDAEDFGRLVAAYAEADRRGLVIYDLMTERYDMLNVVTRRLLSDGDFFGVLDRNASPAIRMKSIHHFYKVAAGKAVVRPEWYYDVRQQGEGIADVTTHLIDLIFWQCFPDMPVCYGTDVSVTAARHYPTLISADMYAMSTGAADFPDYLEPYVSNGVLHVMSNGTISFTVKGIPVTMEVIWNFTPEAGGGDTFEAEYRGSEAVLSVVQDASTGFVKQLFAVPVSGNETGFEDRLHAAVERLLPDYPFLRTARQDDGRYLIEVPSEYRLGHEEHFNKVAQAFLGYVRGESEMPGWEKENTLSKYYVTSQAVMIAAEDE